MTSPLPEIQGLRNKADAPSTKPNTANTSTSAVTPIEPGNNPVIQFLQSDETLDETGSLEENIQKMPLQHDVLRLQRTTSESSYFLNPRTSKVDRRNYVSLKERGYPPACLFVASLSNTRTIEELTESVTNLFRAYGQLLNVKVHIDAQQRPFAFVQFKVIHTNQKVQDANDALFGLNKAFLNNRVIRIERAKVFRTISIILPGLVMDFYIRNILSVHGEIESIDMKPGPIGYTIVLVKFAFREDACDAMAHISSLYKWQVKWANHEQSATIYVGNLHHDVNRENLFNRYCRYGSIESISLIDRQKGAKRFGFIKFAENKFAVKAIRETNGNRFYNQIIHVGMRKDCMPNFLPVDE